MTMRKRLFITLAVILFAGVFLLPMTAFAEEESADTDAEDTSAQEEAVS